MDKQPAGACQQQAAAGMASSLNLRMG